MICRSWLQYKESTISRKKNNRKISMRISLIALYDEKNKKNQYCVKQHLKNHLLCAYFFQRYPRHALFWGNIKIDFHCQSFLNRDGTGSQNLSLWKKMTDISHMDNTVVANVVKKAASPMVCSMYLGNILVSALQGLTHLPLAQHICVSESGQHWFR